MRRGPSTTQPRPPTSASSSHSSQRATAAPTTPCSSTPRPPATAHLTSGPAPFAYYICLLTDHVDGANEWNAAYRRLVPESEIINPYWYPGYDDESYALTDLIDELVVAASLGGVCSLKEAAVRIFVSHSAHREVDAGLAAAVENKTLPTAERLLFRALRVYLRAKMRRLAGEEIVPVLENYGGGGGGGNGRR